MDLINKLRKHPNSFDCLDASLALEQAIEIMKKAVLGQVNVVEVHYWLNTWNKDEEEE